MSCKKKKHIYIFTNIQQTEKSLKNKQKQSTNSWNEFKIAETDWLLPEAETQLHLC